MVVGEAGIGVNFYKRHIGDYLKDTAHLSLLEHGVYTRLLDVYYTRESGIPDDQASRLIGARSKDECAALKIVLGEFFKLVDGMWMQDRCEREIHAMSKPEDDGIETKSGKAVRQQRYRGRRKAMFDRLREHGVVMSYDASMDDLQDALLRVTVMPPVTLSVTPETHNVTATISHKPDSISQTPDLKPNPEEPVVAHTTSPEEPPAPPALEIVPNNRGAAISILMRRNGVEGCNAANPIVDEWSKDPRVTDDLLLTAASMAKARDVLRPGPAYLAPIVKDLLNPKPVKPKQDDWHRSDAGIKRKASELGIASRPGWSYDQLKAAVWDEIKRRERQGAVA